VLIRSNEITGAFQIECDTVILAIGQAPNLDFLHPEDGVEIADLKAFTRELMTHMERDLGTRLEWVAVDHWDTDNPHTHVVLRGKDSGNKDLIIDRDYITQGLRGRAAEVAESWLGLRSEQEIEESLHREIEQERWTRIDKNTVEYVVTIDDKTTWTKPWTVKEEFVKQSDSHNRIYKEPRCHEGNFGMVGMLAGVRAQEVAFGEGRGPDPARSNVDTPTNAALDDEDLDDLQ